MQKNISPYVRKTSFEINPLSFSVNLIRGKVVLAKNTIDSHFHEKCEIYVNISGNVSFMVEKNIYSVISVIEGAGLKVIDITISGLCDYYEVKNKTT